MSEKRVSGLFIYPIKSLGGIALTEAKVEIRGLEHDRRWMLVDQDGLFLSQRIFPKMALLRPTFDTGNLIINGLDKSTAPLKIPLMPNTKGTKMEVRVWDSLCKAVTIGKEYDDWFSKVLNTTCHLVYLPDHSIRPINQKYIRHNEQVSFADGYPYLILGEAALEDLNHRLEKPIQMNRFRPNIVFSGGTPNEEDHWTNIQIGAANFRGIKPCARCQITTINQESAAISKEPLKTMAKYRRQNNDVIFGLNACPEMASDKQEAVVIRLGDAVVNIE